MSDDEETNDPLVADVRNFYKVEKWTRDGSKVDSLLYAGNNLDKAREIFAKAIKHRPRISLTIRQKTRFCGVRRRDGSVNGRSATTRFRPSAQSRRAVDLLQSSQA
jgi:hypothetical protein